MSTGDVQIIRDIDGVAHVRADTLAGALRGQGFAAAQDRSWQMELDRRKALGRLAELVGPSALASDTFHRRMDLAGAARATCAALGDEARDALEAYADGVNAHLAGGERPLELELLDADPEPWEPWHSVAVYQVRHLAMGTFETKVWRSALVRNLGPERAWRLWAPQPELTVEPGAEMARDTADVTAELVAAAAALAEFGDGDASNNLALAPGRTATGRPILAGDPHRALDLPNVYWQNHLTCEAAGVDVIGLSFAGVPGFPHFGHNQDVAWCITHGMADDQDVYVVDLRDAGGGVEYRYDGAWRPAAARTETVAVAGGDAVEVQCLSTHHGPVVSRHDRHGLALRWTALAAPDTTFDALVPMLRAASVDELDDALRSWVLPVNNLLMADTTGAIAYRMRGRLARRTSDNGWGAVPGHDPARDWAGFVSDAQLPRWRDPEPGFLVTANNRVAAAAPYVSHDFAHPARAHRLTERIADVDDWSIGAVAALLGDTYSSVAAVFADRILALECATPAERAAQSLLETWDHHCDGRSAATALYGAVRAELVGIVAHELGLVDDRLPGVPGPSLHQAARFTNARLATWIGDRELVPDAAVASAMRLAVRRLELEQGADPHRWRWDVSHTALWTHPLVELRPDLADQLPTPPTVGLGGDNECLWATSTAPPSPRASNAQVARYVFDVGDWDRSVWIVPHGVSGDPRSPHHLDQLAAWASMGTRPMRYSAAAVDAATESVTEL